MRKYRPKPWNGQTIGNGGHGAVTMQEIQKASKFKRSFHRCQNHQIIHEEKKVCGWCLQEQQAKEEEKLKRLGLA